MLYCNNDFKARQLSLQIYENLFSWETVFEIRNQEPGNKNQDILQTHPNLAQIATIERVLTNLYPLKIY